MIASEVPPSEHTRCGCPACCRAWRATFAPAPDWPVDPESGRLICTLERPMPEVHQGQWLHPAAEVVGDCGQGCCDDMRCPACGAEWRMEWPD